MLWKSTAQALSRHLFGDSSDNDSDSTDLGNFDQNANASGFDITDFFSSNRFGNVSPFGPDPYANAATNYGSGDGDNLFCLTMTASCRP
jgi:hypothetical protein